MNNPYLHILSRLLGYAGLWIMGGYMAGMALETIGFTGHQWSIILAALNLLLGLALFKIVTDDPTLERIFFNLTKTPPDHIGYKIVQSLWILPFVLLFTGLLMWFWAIIINFLLQD